uniref:Neurofibromin 1 n=1 Tax=Kwoniella dejecticola CBS 10117 TaxID=1296121 RepID=A0A1A5ZU75_9TREE|nr:neurofibromin 1 [Kwoniella dejecticola CBS 10117]OBR81362.1 neurofibromin 1 [Kwoniella dejecticola CBS 10117]
MPVRRNGSSPHHSFSSPSGLFRSSNSSTSQNQLNSNHNLSKGESSVNQASSTFDTRSIDETSSIIMRPENNTPEQKVINSLVFRIVNKLPCNSGTRLAIMEVDPGVQATIGSLLQLSRSRLPLIVQSLVGALETLSKYTSSSSLAETSLDILHSQLYLLHILNLCLSTSWQVQSQNAPPPQSEIPRCWPDPHPFDDILARYMLGIMLIYARSVSSDSVNHDRVSPAPTKESKISGTSSTTSSMRSVTSNNSAYTLGTKFFQEHSYPSSSTAPQNASNKTKMLSACCTTPTAIITQMMKYISRVIFYLSASNWNLILSRMRSRIGHLQTTIEESPDVIEMKLLEWSNLDRNRLSQVLQEINNTFIHVKRPAQLSIANALRKATWNWIEVHPSEYESFILANRKMEGGVEALWETLWSLSDSGFTSSNARRTKTFYPLLAMLMVLTPDIFTKMVATETTHRTSPLNQAAFIDRVRKGLSSSKSVETCAMVYVDMVKVAMALSPKHHATGVRSLVPDIQSDVKHALFGSSTSTDVSDSNVLIDGLVALYRSDSDTVSSTLFPRLLTSTVDLNKIVAVRACVVIAVEGQRLPWFAPMSDLRRVVAPSLRAILKNYAQSLSLRRRAAPELPSGQTDLVNEILLLYSLDPQFVFESCSSDQSSSSTDSLNQLLLALSSLTVIPSPDSLSPIASRTACVLIDEMRKKCLGDKEFEALATSAGGAIWQVLLDIGRQTLFAFHNADSDDVATAMNALRESSSTVLRLAEEFPSVLFPSPMAQPAAMVISVAGFTTCAGPDSEQISLTLPMLSVFGKITRMAHMSAMGQLTPATSGLVPDQRANAFDALAMLPTSIGRQQQQRQIRRTLRPLAISTPFTIGLWIGLAAVAQKLTAKILAVESDATLSSRDVRRRALTADIDGLDEEESKEWQNLISWLCACVGVANFETKAPPSLCDIIGKGILPPAYDQQILDPHVPVEAFVKQCVDLLVSSSINVRETAKNALGSELPTNGCKMIVGPMIKLLSHAIGPAGVSVSEPFTAFAEQSVSVLRLIIDRMGPSDDSPTVQVDLGELFYLLAQYIHRLGRGDVALRLKTRFCHLIEIALKKPDNVTLSNKLKFKNAFLDWMSEWSLESMRDNDKYVSGLETTSKAQRELNHACLRAMVPVTDGLVLTNPGEEGDNSQGVVRSRLFYKHYHHLVKVLERSSFEEAESVGYTSSLHGTGNGNLKEPPSHDAPILAILALSNLLSANVDVGLKHCLTLGYHEDPVLRTASMQLMTNTLQQGARFGGLSSKNQRSAESTNQYLDLMSGPNLALALAMVDVCPQSGNEVDELSTLLFRVFEGTGALLGLMRALIEREVAMTNHESELFRANSITMRMLTIFAKTYGYNYVRLTLQPLVLSLIEKPAECSFELDPSKASGTDDIDRNADHLRLMCQALLDLICSSTPRVPLMFRALCHHIWELVDDRFPDSRHSAVGSFIFLRFFCPAIVSPESIDLDVNPDTRETRRALLLITKVIQNLANNVIFKEPHMKVLNSFLSENIRQVTKFLSDIAVSRLFRSLVLKYQALNEVPHRFVYKYQGKIETSLANMPKHFRNTAVITKAARTELDGKAALENLQKIMERSGPPPTNNGLSASARSQVYDEFMQHNLGRNTDSVADAFYEGPASQNGRRIFYFIVSRVALVDYDLLAYHVFSLLDKVTDFFDVVIDLTNFSAANELPLPWLKRSIQLFPPGILPSIHTLAIYNPNTYAKKRIKRLPDSIYVAPAVGKNVIACSSPSELADFIPFTSLALPEYTMALAFEADHVFTNLLCVADHETQVPVIVKQGHGSLQIASWKKQELLPGIKSYVIDVVRLHDIDDIIVGNGAPSDHLVIKHSQGETLVFVSRRRNEMAQIIRAARARLREGPSNERALRPSDVPATLLNVALLNLSSSDGRLRMGAYILLNELCQFFKYDLASRVLRVSAGLTIPNNSLAFVGNLSRALAASVPHLTLEFLKEWTIGFGKADTPLKTACLHYVGPWLVNLDQFSRPTKEDGLESIKQVREIIRAFIGITVTERRRLHLAIQEQVWAILTQSHESLADIVIIELIHAAVDAGIGSDKAECVGDILVSVSSTAVRGKVIAKLRKTLAQTYLKPSGHITENAAWPEICSLARITLILGFNPSSSLDTQLFLPELFHIITLLLGAGPVLMRQTIFGLLVNVIQSLAANPTSGDMDSTLLQNLLKRVQQPQIMAAFGLTQGQGSIELSGLPVKDETDLQLLERVEEASKFLGEVLAAGAISVDCANAWRARWMGLVAATCFQHNPATQPQAFTVLGYLASDEVDDDLVYQILVAMSTTLSHFQERDSVLLISMLRCLSRIINGLLPDSRYASSLFWLAVAILQLGYIPLFAPALDLMNASLKAVSETTTADRVLHGKDLMDFLSNTRRSITEQARKLDQTSGVSFETDLSFSLVAIIYKGVRHPTTRKLTVDSLLDLLRLSAERTRPNGEDEMMISPGSIAYFIALLSTGTSGNAGNGNGNEEIKNIFRAAGLEMNPTEDLANIAIFDMLSIPDNSTALLLVSLVVALLSGSGGSDGEKVVLYRLLADASAEMPEVVAMTYDVLIPRIISTLTTTSNLSILRSTSIILERALSDSNYSLPNFNGLPSTDSSTSLNLYQQQQQQQQQQNNHKMYASSISSSPSLNTNPGGGGGTREQVLEDLGMKGLSELGFTQIKGDKLLMMAKWIAGLIEGFTI